MSRKEPNFNNVIYLEQIRTNPVCEPETIGQAAARLLAEMDRKKAGQEIGAKQPPTPKLSNGGIREVRAVTEKGKK